MTSIHNSTTRRRALVLDFDGVIVETEKLHFDCWNVVFEQQFGIRLAGSHHQCVGLTLDEILTLWCNAASPEPITLTPQMERDLLIRKTELYYEMGADTLLPVPGLTELIQQARGHDWYVTVASRSRRSRLLRTLEILKLPVHFDLIMGTEDVVDPVSDRKIHSRTVAPFGVEPAASVVIEDSVSGIQDAQACRTGLVIGLTTSLDEVVLRAAGADHVVGSLFEARNFIAEATNPIK